MVLKRKIHFWRLAWFVTLAIFLSSVAKGATFTVTNTADSGAGSKQGGLGDMAWWWPEDEPEGEPPVVEQPPSE